MFLAGLTAARFGLHLFDLCIIQLFQEGVRRLKEMRKTIIKVEEEKRGVFSGVEMSLCYGMDLIKFVLVRINFWISSTLCWQVRISKNQLPH